MKLNGKNIITEHLFVILIPLAIIVVIAYCIFQYVNIDIEKEKDVICAKIILSELSGNSRNFGYFDIRNVYIQIENVDPDPMFLDFLQKRIKINIKPYSACVDIKYNDFSHKISVIDRKTFENGIIFSINRISKHDNNSVDVDFSYHAGPFYGGCENINLEKTYGRWEIMPQKGSIIVY